MERDDGNTGSAALAPFGDAASSLTRCMTTPSLGRPLRLMVVEDEEMIALTVKDTVEDLGHLVCGLARSEAEALSLAREVQPDLALTAVKLSGPSDGIETARRLSADFGIRSIFLCGHGDHATMTRLTSGYPLGVVHKPFSAAQFKSALDLAARRLHRHGA